MNLSSVACLIPIALVAALGCSSKGSTASTLSGSGGGNTNSGAGANGSSSTGFGTNGASTGTTGPCTGLQCQIHSCTGGGSTTISGTIYDPAGKNPLYGIVAYVPNSKPLPFTAGASCTTCSDLYTGDPIAAAVTDAKGKFTIKNAPDGPNIPLVIQVGKWRRQFTIPTVGLCADTPMPDKTLLLPKKGSEGDMPTMAISTGGADTLECLLSRIGVDPTEYESGPGAGHIKIFQGSGGDAVAAGSPAPEAQLWDSMADIMKYDIVILSCEGHETDNMNQQVLFDYAKAGGRVFASHFHYSWFNSGPFGSGNLAQWTPGSQNGSTSAVVQTTLWNGMPFVRGQAMQDWLTNVGALVNGKLQIVAPRHNADLTMANTPSQPWLVASLGASEQAQDFTFDTPLGAPAAMQCGRVAFSDMHVAGGSMDNTNQPTPSECANKDLSPQEKALEFIFFDLSSCVTPNNMQMPPPGMNPM